jgi:uncharacterized membrane protein YphA (DoxX/SURF4 family)
MQTKRIGYWIITTTLALALLSGGFAGLIQRPENVEFMTHLGYPVYFGMIIGFWKVLGGVAILSPGFPRLKEWAYAGIFFNMTGAATSHVFAGDAAWHVVVPAGIRAACGCFMGPAPVESTSRSDCGAARRSNGRTRDSKCVTPILIRFTQSALFVLI